MALVAAVSVVVLVFVEELYPEGNTIAFYSKVTLVLGVSGFLLTPFVSKWIQEYIKNKATDADKIITIIRKLGIQKDEEFPTYQGKIQLGFQTAYYYSLPCGLALSDFTKHKSAMEQYLQRYIEIYYERGQIVIEVSNEWIDRVV